MSHYFETGDMAAKRHNVKARIWDKNYELISATGIFSFSKLDKATKVLLDRIAPGDDEPARILDLGCGYGPIAIALACERPQARIDAVDVNELAIELTKENAERYQVADRVYAGLPDEFAAASYDEIWSNPPIRIGKSQLHQMLGYWLAKLVPNGRAYLVVGKNLGADSLANWMVETGYECEKLASAKGFRVLRVVKGTDS